MKILMANTSDVGGGAEKVTMELLRAYRRRGHAVKLAVGVKRGTDPDVCPIDNCRHRNLWVRFWDSVHSRCWRKGWGAGRAALVLQYLGRPRRVLAMLKGEEDFDFPATRDLPDLCPGGPDILHCNNLHGGFFDLRSLAWLSHRVPVVLRLSDMWLLTGHCSHSFDCAKWETGCGDCPDLSIPPALRRDGTAQNWQRKRGIYARSRLYVSAPSQWLMDRVQRSILARGLAGSRVIPNGVDLSVFRPADRDRARGEIGVPAAARVLLFAANSVRTNVWKDYRTMRAALAIVAERLADQDVVLVALGEEAGSERVGRSEVRFAPYEKDPRAVARYYQTADVYVHAARVDTFPNAVLEALACGTPVVATAVGGIPEQVKSLNPGAACRDEEATGMLVPAGDAEGLAACLETLLTREGMRRRLGENAARDARARFDLERMVEDYLAWYAFILDEAGAGCPQETAVQSSNR